MWTGGATVGRVLLRLLRAVLVVAAVVGLALLLVGGLVVVQGQRDDTRRADAIAGLYLASSPPAHLDQMIQLYRQGYAARLFLAGNNLDDAEALLVSRGLPAEVIFRPDEDSGGRFAAMQDIAALAAAEESRTILLVSPSDDLLLELKMSADTGLVAFGSPLPDTPLDLPDVLRSTLEYWRYVLVGW
ncbi:MAG: hypothetical protein HC876_07385 [Chloroflexaceae bacterium]|nr:hypothetical protein [Chloroflexaceae bacterium]